MRAYVYVDGFNLYYRALKGTPHRWLNLEKLAGRLLDPNDTVELVRYFTARVSSRAGDTDAPRRQQIYLSALGTLPSVRVHYGRFLAKTKWRPLRANPQQFVEVLDTEEKGSDVNLAAHLLNDAWRNRFDVALVVSQDTDLVEPLRMVRHDLHKTVGLVWLDGTQPNKHLVSATSFVRHVGPSDLAASQFPNPLIRNPEHPLHKPNCW